MIEFDEKKHQYKVDGEVKPSVTEILEHMTAVGYGKVNPGILAEAKERGTAVHQMTQDIDLGMPPEEMDAYIGMYILAYLRFLADYDVEWEYIEYPFYASEYGFCGTIDRVGTIDGERSVLDIKTTSSPSVEQKMAVCCQTSAYAEGIGEPLCRRYALYLHSDGNYELLDCSEYEAGKKFSAWGLFLQMNELHYEITRIRKTRATKPKGKEK